VVNKNYVVEFECLMNIFFIQVFPSCGFLCIYFTQNEVSYSVEHGGRGNYHLLCSGFLLEGVICMQIER
jgi:hypothetical protein